MGRTRHPLVAHLVGPLAIEAWGRGLSLSFGVEDGFLTLGRTGGLT